MDSGRTGIGTHNLGNNLNPTSYINQPVIQDLQSKSLLFNLQKDHVLLSCRERGSWFNTTTITGFTFTRFGLWFYMWFGAKRIYENRPYNF